MTNFIKTGLVLAGLFTAHQSDAQNIKQKMRDFGESKIQNTGRKAHKADADLTMYKAFVSPEGDTFTIATNVRGNNYNAILYTGKTVSNGGEQEMSVRLDMAGYSYFLNNGENLVTPVENHVLVEEWDEAKYGKIIQWYSENDATDRMAAPASGQAVGQSGPKP